MAKKMIFNPATGIYEYVEEGDLNAPAPTTPTSPTQGAMERRNGWAEYGDYDPAYESALMNADRMKTQAQQQYDTQLAEMSANLAPQYGRLERQWGEDKSQLARQMAGRGMLYSTNYLQAGRGKLDTGYQEQRGALDTQKQQIQKFLDSQRQQAIKTADEMMTQAEGEHANWMTNREMERAYEQAELEANTPPYQTTPTGQLIPVAETPQAPYQNPNVDQGQSLAGYLGSTPEYRNYMGSTQENRAANEELYLAMLRRLGLA